MLEVSILQPRPGTTTICQAIDRRARAQSNSALIASCTSGGRYGPVIVLSAESLNLDFGYALSRVTVTKVTAG